MLLPVKLLPHEVWSFSDGALALIHSNPQPLGHSVILNSYFPLICFGISLATPSPSRTMGFYFWGQEGMGGSSLIFAKPEGSPSPTAFPLCPVHEAPLTDQLHPGSWEETAVHCGRCFGSPLGRETDTFRGRVSERPLPPLVTFI